MGQFLFHVPLRGSVPLLFGVAAIFLAGSLSLGILISIVTKNQLLASQLAMVLTFLPSFLLSGSMREPGGSPTGRSQASRMAAGEGFALDSISQTLTWAVGGAGCLCLALLRLTLSDHVMRGPGWLTFR